MQIAKRGQEELHQGNRGKGRVSEKTYPLIRDISQVRLRVNSLELSKRFLGYDQDLSLLEADCTLLGLNK